MIKFAAALPSMVENILIIASSGIIASIPNLVISNGLCSALVAFAKTLSVEVAGPGVNTIVPGRIATPRPAELDQAADREKSDAATLKQNSVQAIPAGRYGDSQNSPVSLFLDQRTRQPVTGPITRVDDELVRSM